jgi:tellurite resistance protein
MKAMASGSGDRPRFSPETAKARANLRGRIDTAAEQIAVRTALAETLGTDDREVLERLELLGFNADSARVLDVLPLVHVAWADGKIQERERALVLAVLEGRNLGHSSDAWLLIEALLETRPSETFLAQSLSILRLLAKKKGNDPESIVDLCTRVAEASGGIFGIGSKVSSEERALIERIAAALGPDAVDAVMDRVSRPVP